MCLLSLDGEDYQDEVVWVDMHARVVREQNKPLEAAKCTHRDGRSLKQWRERLAKNYDNSTLQATTECREKEKT